MASLGKNFLQNSEYMWKTFRPWSGIGIRFNLYSLGSWNHRSLQKVKQLLQTRPSKKASNGAEAAVLQNGYRLWHLRVLQKISLWLVLIYYWFRENYFLWASKFVFVISKSLSYLTLPRSSSLKNSQRIVSPVKTDFNSGHLLRTLEY